MDKLYLNDSYIKSFKADIQDIKHDGEKVLIVLDRTAFYPEGGGQPSDTGSIGDCRINYVYEKDGIIYHEADKEPESTKNIECSIDWDRRFDHMQQHCGQHILSACFDKLLNGKTIGFHLGSEYVTVDIAIDSLSIYNAREVENYSNEIIFKNLPIIYHYPTIEELSKFDLRKAPTVTDNIRIVEIKGFDYSPCGGTHPSHTGEIGLIKIRKWEKYKNTVRVEFVCGKRALYDYSWKNEYINEASNLLSSKDTDVLENIKKVYLELNTLNKEIRTYKDKLLSYEALELKESSVDHKGIKIIKKIFDERDIKEISALSNKISNLEKTVALLGVKSKNAHIIFARSSDIDINMNELFKEVIPIINGKGGGNAKSAQGGGSDASKLDDALNSAYELLKKKL